jgi:hypothetical protein
MGAKGHPQDMAEQQKWFRVACGPKITGRFLRHTMIRNGKWHAAQVQGVRSRLG